MSNYELQKSFLEDIKELAISNPDKEINSNFIHSYLARYNVSDSQVYSANIEDKFKQWNKTYKKFLNVRSSDNCFGLSKGYPEKKSIVVTIPLDSKHINAGADQILDYMSKKSFPHLTCIINIIRNDNIQIYVNSIQDAADIVNYLKNNSYINEGMLMANPFLPNVNGFGITMDNAYSYSGELCKLIKEYLDFCMQNESLDKFNIVEFNKYVSNCCNYVKDDDLKDIYFLLSQVTTPNFKLQDFVNFTNNKTNDKYTDDKKLIQDPKYYLEQAVISTNIIHPENKKIAILEYLKGNPNYFTNRNKEREGLTKYVRPSDLISLMRSKLSENNIPIPHNDDKLVEEYTNIVFSNSREKDFEALINAYISTLNLYGELQAKEALKDLLLNGNLRYFTNKLGDRDKLSNLMGKIDILRLILNNIDINNLDVNNTNEIVDRFSNIVNGMLNNAKQY